MTTDGRSLSLEEAAEQLRVSRRTIYNRIKTGELQTVRTIGGSQRVRAESMAAYVAGHPREEIVTPAVDASDPQGDSTGNPSQRDEGIS